MAFLIPENLPSRSDVPARFQSIAAALRDQLDDAATVWLENLAVEAQLNLPLTGSPDIEQEKPFLAVAVPGSGLLLIDVLEGGRRALDRTLRQRLGNNTVDNAIRRLRGLSRPGLSRLRQNHEGGTPDFQVVLAVAAPHVNRSAAPSLAADSARKILFTEDCARLDKAIPELFSGGRRASASGAENERRTISAALHPEIVIIGKGDPPEQGRLALRQSHDYDKKNVVKTLDRDQELLARWIGGGYRVIKGVAGSGKTLVLVSRAKLIGSALPNRRVLLTCYNRVLADTLAQQLKDYPSVTVKNIDRLPFDSDWNSHIRSKIGKAPDYSSSGDQDDDQYTARVETCIQFLKQNPQAGFFDVVLVDEAQDFDPRRLEFAYCLLNPEAEDFIVARDAAQNVYRRPEWIPPGTSGRGRTKFLNVNYRNTQQILFTAFKLLLRGQGDKLDRRADPEIADVIIPPKAALRKGPAPEVVVVGPSTETRAITDRILELGRNGVRWDSIAVLCGNSRQQSRLERSLRQKDIPVINTSDPGQRDRAATTTNHVIVASLRHLKGLEFPHVFLSGLSDISVSEGEDDEKAVRRSLYVAMTRSTQCLTIMVSGDEPYLRELQEIINELPP